MSGLSNLYRVALKLQSERHELYRALEALVDRCDGAEGVRADGSNIDTRAERMLLERVRGTGDGA